MGEQKGKANPLYVEADFLPKKMSCESSFKRNKSWDRKIRLGGWALHGCEGERPCPFRGLSIVGPEPEGMELCGASQWRRKE